MSRLLLIFMAFGMTALHAQVAKGPVISTQAFQELPSAPTQTFEERPFSLDTDIEQKYSFTRQIFLNPLKVALNYRTPHGSYRIGLGYSYTPQTGESAIGLGLRFHILSFGERRE